MKIFLSYAEEDHEIARLITDRLDQEGHTIFNWRDPGQRGRRFRQQIERGIKTADAFLALLSPSSLRSDWCGRELDMAIPRERALQDSNPEAAFIHVVLVTQVRPPDAGTLASYDWLDMTSPGKWEGELDHLAGRFRPASAAAPPASGEAGAGPLARPTGAGRETPRASPGDEPVFRNREDELHKVLQGLTNPGGMHFWLVVAPPQLGKSWFLKRVSVDPTLANPGSWITRLIDLRAEPPVVRGDVSALLALLFGRAPSEATDPETLFSIAREIAESGRPHLCLLDSAELLAGETASVLRACLGRVYRMVQDAGIPEPRLTFVVASRRDDEWKGVAPVPRLSPLPLTEFNIDVVQQALRDLAAEMKRTFSQAEFGVNAARVHRLTEGLPALLVQCLQWIRANQWLGMDRLETQRSFEELAGLYIQQELLTPATLQPAEDGEDEAQLRALVQAYRVLAPYRIFTQSHLRNHQEADPEFRDSLEAAGWAMADLWKAISGTALRRRPLTEPWQEIHAAIRRLLYRYFYKTGEERAEAHNEARKFVEVWTEGQIGTEQAVGLVECLWHEAIALGLRNSAEMEQRLTGSARKLSLQIRESPAYTPHELRLFAAERMANDEELQEAIGNPDLFDTLVAIVIGPEDRLT